MKGEFTMKNLRKNNVFVVALLLSVISVSALAKTGQDVIDEMKEEYGNYNDQVVTLRLQTYDKGKMINDRQVILFNKDDNGTQKSLLKFLSPKDVEGVGLLDQGDDNMYLYLPEFHKEKRIAGSAKNGSFMGTDFTYADLSLINYDSSDYKAELIKETNDVYELELQEKDQTSVNYSKLIMTVRKSDLFPTSIVFYNTDGKLEKVLSSYDVTQAGKYKYPKKLEMENKITNHKTVIHLQEPEFDVGLADSIFTVRSLQRSKIRY